MTVADLKHWLAANKVSDDCLLAVHDHFGKLIEIDVHALHHYGVGNRYLGARAPHVQVSPPYIGEEPD